MQTPANATYQYSRDELEAMDGTPVVLNLGCGTDDAGIGVDIHYSPDIHADLNDGIPVAANTADTIVAEHVLEHLDDPTQFFAECRRVLRNDGRLEIEAPNVGWLPVRLWLSQDLQRFWTHKDPGQRGHWLARRLGNTDDRRTAHRTLWTPQLLREYLDRHDFEYDLHDSHWSRNIRVTASPDTDTAADARTLHELERQSGDDLASQDYWAQTRARILAAWIQERDPRRILDAGCGSGYLTQLLAERTAADVHGIDLDESSVALATQRDTAASFEVGDVRDLGSWQTTYDAVVFADVLEHFETPAGVLSPARDVLADDGSVFVSLPAHDWLWGPHDDHNDHHARYDRDSLAAVAAEAGLEIERARYTNAIPLAPYWLYQRVLQRPVPDSARGGHNRVVEFVKSLCIRSETAISPPVGVTLIAELVEA